MSGTKIAGYILSILGLGAIALSNKIAPIIFKANPKGLAYTALGAVVLIVVGIVLVMSSSSSSSNIKQASEEVPIYQGEGKNKKIVGYKKAEK